MTRRLLRPADLGALSACAPEMAEAMVSLAHDIALVIDERGVITRVAQNPGAPVTPAAERWVGRRWVETVTEDTRRKIDLMLTDVHTTGVGRRREVNHAGDAGHDIPVAYTALRLGEHGPVIAVGRDLRAVAAIQQRFLDAQQEIERGYWRARQNESRYWLLFQVATDAVMTVEGQSLRIVEANQAATGMFGGHGGALAGRVAAQQFEGASTLAVHELLSSTRASGRAAEIHAQVAGSHLPVSVSAAPFHTGDGLRLLLRVRAAEPTAAVLPLNAVLSRLVDGARDGVVVTDSGGRIMVANPAFVQLAGAESEAQVRGSPLAEWVGRVASDIPSLIANVHGHGIARLVHSSLRRHEAGPVDVDVSAALLSEGDQERFGFTVSPCGPLANPAPPAGAGLTRAIAQLDAALGSLSLPDLLLQAEQLARGHLMQRALERTAGDKAAAARLLGIGLAEFDALRGPQAQVQ